MRIIIKPNGDVTYVAHEAIDGDAIGSASKRRASHVLPVNPLLRCVFRRLRDWFGETGIVASFTRRWPCLWRADLSPVGGPTLGPFVDRRDAIAAEIEWIEGNVL